MKQHIFGSSLVLSDVISIGQVEEVSGVERVFNYCLFEVGVLISLMRLRVQHVVEFNPRTEWSVAWFVVRKCDVIIQQ